MTEQVPSKESLYDELLSARTSLTERAAWAIKKLQDDLDDRNACYDEIKHAGAISTRSLRDQISRLNEQIEGLQRELTERARSTVDMQPNSTRHDAGSNPAGRSTHEPIPARKPDKFDLAFEIMRQLDAEDMETMQSCQFGYVMRITREGAGCGQVEFRPIATAPKDGSTILLRCPKGIVEGCWEQVDGGGHPENGPPVYWWTSPFTEFIDGPYDAPTHWALIPRDAPTKPAEQP